MEKSKTQNSLGTPNKKISHELEIVLFYRVLKSSIFFTIVWTLIAMISVMMTKITKTTIYDLHGFTLVIATLYSTISAIQSFARYGGKYISVYDEHMVIHYSILHHQKIVFNTVSSMLVENENAEFITSNGKVNVPLAHLSFDDQKIFLDTIGIKLKQVQ